MDEEPAQPVMSDPALAIEEAMGQMSKEQRNVFVARGIDRLTRRETAVVLGLTEGRVQYLYMGALTIVAEVLDIDAT